MLHLNIKHWSYNNGWMIDDYLHVPAMRRTKEVLAFSKYIVVTRDKVIIVDNLLRIPIHAYYVQDSYMHPMLVSLVR